MASSQSVVRSQQMGSAIDASSMKTSSISFICQLHPTRKLEYSEAETQDISFLDKLLLLNLPFSHLKNFDVIESNAEAPGTPLY